MDQKFQNLPSWLLKGSIDFNYISESLLPTLCENATAPLKVGEMEYDAIIVPDCETLRSTTLERLEKFRKAGGKLIFAGNSPLFEDGVPSERGKTLYEKSTVVAFDSNVVCVDMLEKGEIDALIVQNPYAMGYLGVETAYQVMNGAKIEETIIDTATKLVTKENMYTEECQRMLFLFDD